MLVLGRKENESILIGDSIRITIVGRCGSSIKLGVEAPRDVQVWREEIRNPEATIVNHTIQPTDSRE
jgi:carbon storage regulator